MAAHQINVDTKDRVVTLTGAVDSAAANAAESSRVTPRLTKLRTQFHSLVLGNPNYFGNMPDLGFKQVEVLKGNTTYEQLTCIGLNPDANRLEAVVNIKQSSGYGTNACGEGSTEYVRFFVLRSDGWHDLGDTSFTAYNVPASPRPLALTEEVGCDFPCFKTYKPRYGRDLITSYAGFGSWLARAWGGIASCSGE